MWPRVVSLLFGIVGLCFLNYLAAEHLNQFTTALFLIFSVMVVAGLANLTINPRPTIPTPQKDDTHDWNL